MENAPNDSHQDIAEQIKRESDFVSVTLQNALHELMDRRRHKDRRRQFENGFKATDEEVIDGVFWQYSFQFSSTEVEPSGDDEADELERVNQYYLVRESTEDIDVSQLSDVERRAFIRALEMSHTPGEDEGYDEDDEEDDDDERIYMQQIAAGLPIPCQRTVRTLFCCDEAGMALEMRDDTVTYQIGNGVVYASRLLVDIANKYDGSELIGYNFLRDAGALIKNDTIGVSRHSASDDDLVIMRDILQNLGLGGGSFDAVSAAPVRGDSEVLQVLRQSFEVDLLPWRNGILDCTQPYIDQLNALNLQDPQYGQAVRDLSHEVYAAIYAYSQSTSDGLVIDDMVTVTGKQMYIERDTVDGFKPPMMREGVIDGVFVCFDIAPRPSEACLAVDMAMVAEEELAGMVDNFGLHIVLEEAYVVAGKDQPALPTVSDLLYVPLQRSYSQLHRYVVE